MDCFQCGCRQIAHFITDLRQFAPLGRRKCQLLKIGLGIAKGAVPNISHRMRNRNRWHGAVVERIIADARHGVAAEHGRNHDRRSCACRSGRPAVVVDFRRAVDKAEIPPDIANLLFEDDRHVARSAVKHGRASGELGNQTRRRPHGLQRGTAGEQRPPERGHFAGNLKSRQRVAALKGKVADADEFGRLVVFAGDVFKQGAVGECTRADVRHSCRITEGRDVIAVGKCMAADAMHGQAVDLIRNPVVTRRRRRNAASVTGTAQLNGRAAFYKVVVPIVSGTVNPRVGQRRTRECNGRHGGVDYPEHLFHCFPFLVLSSRMASMLVE